MSPLACGIVTVLALVSTAACAQDAALTLPRQSDDPVMLRVAEAAEDQAGQHLQVFVGEARGCCDGRTPMAGGYRWEDGTLSFVPAFPFLRAQTYTVLTRTAEGAARRTEFSIPTDAVPAEPAVVAIFPSGPEIPENTLRFYIAFTHPMQPHVAADYIVLENADGAPDHAAFMTFKQELWNEDRTRLTLLMDPGRIKRGVPQNTELGPALEADKTYSIRVKAGWPGAVGGRIRHPFEARFLVTAPLRERPEPSAWTVTAPAVHSLDPLIIHFDRPFDSVQVGHSITVLSSGGQVLLGSVKLSNDSRTWRFTPVAPWSGDQIELVIDARLEDVAGNNFRDVLDHPVGSHPLDIDEVVVPVKLLP